MEQHIDFLTGRLFRRSVLVRREVSGPRRAPHPDRLGALHVASPIRLDPAASTDRLAAFKDERERPITTGDPIIRAAFERLASACPATVGVDALTGSAAAAPQVAAEVAARVRRGILTLVMTGRASISVLPLRVGRADHERPTAWRVARMEAASGQPWITTLGHAGIPTHPVLRALLPYLDGAHDRPALRARLTESMQCGAVALADLPPDSQPSREQLDAVVERCVDQTLRHLAHRAVLEPVAD